MMSSTVQETVSVLRSWKDSESDIQVVCVWRNGGYENFVARLSSASKEGLIKLRSGDKEFELDIGAEDVQRMYSEPRQALSFIREASQDRYKSSFSFLFPNGDKCFLSEMPNS
jgi:hypothetical protein